MNETAPPVERPSGRLGSVLTNRFASAPSKRRLAWAARLLPAIRAEEQRSGKLSAGELIERANSLRGRARMGDRSRKFIAEGFGLASVAVWRTLGYRAFDVQIAAGVVMFRGGLAELATGEGKTLTAAFPAIMSALSGKGVHVATVNDYLASRDAEIMSPAYRLLGLSVGVLQMKDEDAARKSAYACDITYGTASEFGFDFLRDRLKLRGGGTGQKPFWSGWLGDGLQVPLDPRVQRGHACALVDEADSIFVDEARTPLIISAPTRMANEAESVVFRWADGIARTMERNRDFHMDPKKDKIELTDDGRQRTRYANPPGGPHSEAMDKLFEAVERAVHAHHRFVRDHHYMVLKEKIVIVDESTGRPMPDRHWREGLHQAVEAKENVPIHLAAGHAAQITFQNYFRLYQHLCGMSGTLAPNRRELQRVYGLRVVQVPTNRAIKRTLFPDAVYGTESAKFDALVRQAQSMRLLGRPVLIGTRSVEKSDAVSERLKAAGIPHQVLNARQNEQEAEIVAQAGRLGAVTVATNMAGRGTDIVLGGNISKDKEAIEADPALDTLTKTLRIAELKGEWQRAHDAVVSAGGLHVIGTERHEASRVDRQLVGRAGRQGDPGSGQFFLSLEDRLLEALGAKQAAAWEARGAKAGPEPLANLAHLFRKAQRRLEKKHYRQRLDMMYYDRQRRELLGELGADPYVD